MFSVHTLVNDRLNATVSGGFLRRKPYGATLVGLASLWLVASFIFLLMPRDGAVIQMRLQADRSGIAQWYFDRGNGYSESESVTATLRAGENSLIFHFPRGSYKALRFDPINNDAHVKIETLVWCLPAASTSDVPNVGSLVPLANIARTDGALDIYPVSGTNDPQMELRLERSIDLNAPLRSTAILIASALIVSLLLAVVIRLVARQLTLRAVVLLGMAIAATLIVVLALYSTTLRSTHPDEFSHLAAYEYYTNHWLPPSAEDPETLPSTSIWGFSYLFELDVVYDVAAHLTVPLRQWLFDDVRSARTFQCLLWAILFLMAAYRRRWAEVMAVLLLSPQIWYVFAYLNADAFPLFLSMGAACLIADEISGVHRFVRTGSLRTASIWITALCLGLILVSKRNYLPIAPAMLLWLAVWHLRWKAWLVAGILAALLFLGIAAFVGEVPALHGMRVFLQVFGIATGGICVAIALHRSWKNAADRPMLVRVIAFSLMCFAVAAPRVAWDVCINGWPAQKSEHLREIAEARAGVDFKPSTIAAGKGNPTIGLAARGVPLSQLMFAPNHWSFNSAASFFGVYDHMSVFAPLWMYAGFGTISLCALSLVFVAALRAQPTRFGALATVVAGTGVLVAAGSLLLSWFDQLQAQGRYLFPIIPMIALLIGAGRTQLPRRAFALLVLAGFVLSACSFLFVALPAFIDAR